MIPMILMTGEKRQKLRELAVKAMRGPGPWQLQTSNSFRRIGQSGDGDVLCAVTQRSDGHPDLLAPPGVLDYIVEAQPCTTIVLLDYIDSLEQSVKNVKLMDTNTQLFEQVIREMQQRLLALIADNELLRRDLEVARLEVAAKVEASQ